MKKAFNKIKLGLATLGIAIISFSSKVFGLQKGSNWGDQFEIYQDLYGVPSPQLMYGVPSPEPETTINAIVNAIKRFRIPLIIVIFIVGIVNFIKIRKIDDKTLKKKKIKSTAIIILIISIIILLMSISARLIKKYYA